MKTHIKKSCRTHQKYIKAHQMVEHIKKHIKTTCPHQTVHQICLMCFWFAFDEHIKIFVVLWCALMCTSNSQNPWCTIPQSTSNEFDVVHQMCSTSKAHHRCTPPGTSSAHQRAQQSSGCSGCRIWCTIWCRIWCSWCELPGGPANGALGAFGPHTRLRRVGAFGAPFL